MADGMDGTYGDLETRGYVVVRDFLPADVLESLREDYAGSSPDPTIPYLKHASADAAARAMPSVEAVLEQVRARTALQVDMPAGLHYFATGKRSGRSFMWHQDHESWFMVQNHYDYLNFYIPIIKPDVTKSNLRIVPFDVLEGRAPRAYEMLVRRGASRVRSVGGRSFVMSDDTGALRTLPSDIEEYAVTPELAAGDLLLMRGDVVHRTQDTDTERVAFSVRIARQDSVLRRSRLATGGLQKAAFMTRYAVIYEHLFRTFEATGRDELSLKEFAEMAATMSPVQHVSRTQFVKRLLTEKRRAHDLTRFALDAPRAMGLRTVNKVQQRYHRYRAQPAA